MHLPEKAIEEFRALWLAEYAEELTLDEARLHAERFLSGVHQMLVIRPASGAPEVPRSRGTEE